VKTIRHRRHEATRRILNAVAAREKITGQEVSGGVLRKISRELNQALNGSASEEEKWRQVAIVKHRIWAAAARARSNGQTRTAVQLLCLGEMLESDVDD
jgi:hypothetical protein